MNTNRISQNWDDINIPNRFSKIKNYNVDFDLDSMNECIKFIYNESDKDKDKINYNES